MHFPWKHPPGTRCLKQLNLSCFSKTACSFHVNIVNQVCWKSSPISPSPLKSLAVPACRLLYGTHAADKPRLRELGLAIGSSLFRRHHLCLFSSCLVSHLANSQDAAVLLVCHGAGLATEGCGMVLVNKKHDTEREDRKNKYSSIRPLSQPLHKLLEIYWAWKVFLV